MNRLKPVFIAVVIPVYLFFSYMAILLAVNEGVNMPTIGVFMVSIIPTEFFMRLVLLKPWARTSKFLPAYTGAIILGSVSVFYFIANGVLTNDFGIISITSLAFWVAYILWYSKLPVPELKKVQPGHQLPALNFTGLSGEQVNTADFKGKKVIYLWYRGNWCPLCMAQIKELAGEYQALSKRGVEVVLISPQPHKFSLELAKKMKVDFHFLTDEKNQEARQLGIEHHNGVPFGLELTGYDSETVLPTVIITDENAKILFLAQTDNYRVRPEPAAFLKVLDEN